MSTSYELDLFAKTAASSYLTDKTSLNDSIIKMAADNGLNREQISRVVEGANTEVYMKLFNKTNDKYITFDTADAEKIASVVENEIPKVAEFHTSDYEELPPEERTEETFEIFVKTAEEPTQTSADQVLRDFYRFRGVEGQLDSLATEAQIEFSKQADTLKNMIKQAMLGGTPYSELYTAVYLAADPVVVSAVDQIESELKENMPMQSFNKTGSIVGSVNAKHPLVQQTLLLSKIANDYRNIQAKQTELTTEWEIYKTSGMTERVSKIVDNPGVFLGGLTIGAGGTALALPKIAKERIKQERMAPVVPQGYRQ